MADLENNVPVTPQTLFRLASVSKTVTATAAMRLWEQGKLDLDAPVQKYCPAFPQKEWPISTRQLLGHLGGLRHYRSDSEGDVEVNNTRHFDNPIAGGLNFFANDPLVAKPGTKFHYSTQGFTLIGCAIEGAAAENYIDYVRQNVFQPANMPHTQWDDRYALIPHRTRFYSKSKSGAVVNADFLDASYKIPGGGWLSSADDLANFEVAILADRLVKRATRNAMWTPQQSSTPQVGEVGHSGYALGWGTGNSAGVPDVGHGGGQQGTSTFIMLAPEQRAGVVVLINLDGVDASALATDLMKILVGATEKGKQGSTTGMGSVFQDQDPSGFFLRLYCYPACDVLDPETRARPARCNRRCKKSHYPQNSVQTGRATRAPGYLAPCMQTWSEHDRGEFHHEDAGSIRASS